MRSSVLRTRDYTPRRHLQPHQFVFQFGEPPADGWIIEQTGAARAGRGSPCFCVGQNAFGGADGGDSHSFITEQKLGVVPAAVLFADQILDGHAYVLKQYLVELDATGHTFTRSYA